jgi:hypothetical protein
MSTGYKLDLAEGVDFKVKRKHWLPEKLGVDCVAFGRTLYVRKAESDIPRHEFLHLAQFHKYGVLRVILHYLFHISLNVCRYRNVRDSFCNVPFEREARDFEAKNQE